MLAPSYADTAAIGVGRVADQAANMKSAKAPFIATQLNSTSSGVELWVVSWVELSCELSCFGHLYDVQLSWVDLSELRRFGHPLRRTMPIADGRWAARNQSVLSR